jgi:DNA repair exonuclease SbcCD ATPase subunit
LLRLDDFQRLIGTNNTKLKEGENFTMCDGRNTKGRHAVKQQALVDQMAELEKAIMKEDEISRTDIAMIEKRCLEIEFEMKEIESTHEGMMQEQFLERKGEQKKQEKKIELADKLIGELKKENKRLQKQQAKVVAKYNKLDDNSQKIEDMNSSLSSLCESVSTITDLNESKFETLQEEHDATRQVNKDIKNKLRKEQDAYWEVAQSRLEYQKAMAKILTLVQNHLQNAKSSPSETMNEAARAMSALAIEVENEAKIEMAALDIETAGTDIYSDTSYTEVSEALPGEDSEPYLEINLVPSRK